MKRGPAAAPTTARTIRFPKRLRARIASDAARCGRSFESHVLAILRRHFGESVDLVPPPEHVLTLARGSFAGMKEKDRAALARRLIAPRDA